MTPYRWILLPLIGGCLLVLPSSAEEPKKESPAFTKQYLGIFTRSAPKQQIIIQHAKLRQLGGRTFLVGTSVKYDSRFVDPKDRLEPNKAVVRWVLLAEVIEMYEFDDVAGYQEK